MLQFILSIDLCLIISPLFSKGNCRFLSSSISLFKLFSIRTFQKKCWSKKRPTLFSVSILNSINFNCVVSFSTSISNCATAVTIVNFNINSSTSSLYYFRSFFGISISLVTCFEEICLLLIHISSCSVPYNLYCKACISSSFNLSS